MIFKEDMSILDVAKKFRDFNFLFIIESASSVGLMDSRHSSLVFIGGVLLSIEITEVFTTIRLELVRRLITRDSSRLSSLDFE